MKTRSIGTFLIRLETSYMISNDAPDTRIAVNQQNNISITASVGNSIVKLLPKLCSFTVVLIAIPVMFGMRDHYIYAENNSADTYNKYAGTGKQGCALLRANMAFFSSGQVQEWT